MNMFVPVNVTDKIVNVMTYDNLFPAQETMMYFNLS